jgi:hypothetical protein
MINWEELFARRDWVALENWWPNCGDSRQVRAFRDRLRTDVPKIVRENGLERQEDYVHPQEAPDEWKGAAHILLLGELDAAVDGEPEAVPAKWRRSRQEIEQKLQTLLSSDEVTEGDPVLSRKAHAQAAIEYLQESDWTAAAMADEIDPDDRESDDQRWLFEVAAELVCVGFYAGMHARAAIGKEIEVHAIRGEKTQKAASEGGRLRRGKTKPATLLVLNAMDELRKKGLSVANAARLAYSQKRVGSSPEANRKLYSRHKPS